MLDQSVEADDQKTVRDARAQAYFEQDLKGQRQWYSTHSSTYKSRAQILSLLVLAAGAATTFVQVFGENWWAPTTTAALGVFVILMEGWQRIARYNEAWISYRTASERMKRELRLYVNGAGNYRNLDEEQAYLQFVENNEAIIAEEQQIYWQAQRGESGGADQAATSGAPT
jgi:hypothetical protein